MTIFGITFASALVVSIISGAVVGGFAIWLQDPALAFLAGGAFFYPFGFLLGCADGRNAIDG